jgi:hypothetical protein
MTMSQRQTITVQSIESRTTPSTGKAYWRVKSDSGVFFVWEKTIADQLQPGATVVVSTNGSAEYPKIVAVHETRDAASTPDPAVDPVPAAEPTSAVSERERRMLRMSALRAAADVLHGSHVPAGELVEYAEQLLMWLEG